MRGYGIGLDIGGTTCKFGLFEGDGTLIEKWEIPTDTSKQGMKIINNISDSMKIKLEEQGIDQKQLLGVGVGVPGMVYPDGTVKNCVNLGWKSKNLRKELEEKMDCSVQVENDANVATLGEMWRGGAKGTKNVIMMTLGTGVGSGIVLDGNILVGENGAAGEIGHMIVNPKEKVKCACGRYGCLEQYVSATGIVRLAKEEQKKMDKKTGIWVKDDFQAKDIFQAAEEDAVAKKLVNQTAQTLAYALANLAVVVNPEIFIIGGGVSKSGNQLLKPVRSYFIQYALKNCKDTSIELATLGNDAGIYGGMYLVQKKFIL